MGADVPSQELLGYYKSRIDEFDVERQDLLGRISLCQASAAECHSLRCEVQKRTEEVRELQQALSAAHMHLFEERDRLLQLQVENDELRHQDMEHRQQLEQLTALADPINQAITFSRDQDPSTGIVYPQKGGKEFRRKGKTLQDESKDAEHAHRVLRTVFLPAANTDALRLKVESLQAQLAEHKQLSLEQVDALKQDRQLRQQDEEAHRQNYNRQISEVMQKIKRTEEALRHATTDYILARRDKQVAEARAVTAETDLTQQKEQATHKLKLLHEKHQEELDRMHRAHEDALEKATAKLSKSLRNREVEYSQLESMHLAVKAELEQRGHDLEVKLSKTKDKLKQAEHRRALESEGFTNDVSLLRKQLAAVDRKLHQMRLQSRLEDDERLHSMLQKLEKKGAKDLDQNRMHPNMPDRGFSAVESLESIKRGLKQVERRVAREPLRSRAS
eukprot:jgi/Ulvmu1/3018/UM015_0058.1